MGNCCGNSGYGFTSSGYGPVRQAGGMPDTSGVLAPGSYAPGLYGGNVGNYGSTHVHNIAAPISGMHVQ
jgi:hypothetical protein